ncbi:hypothetical protein Taro_013084 [Colocasia esculenta]|uniref:Uncharacterized protein n=1 Tax=Colocasia esculenta TaxID=4460 RepID=A0A843UEL3_COLES|nr:hypothetical protein [Colocasia esculenta]
MGGGIPAGVPSPAEVFGDTGVEAERERRGRWRTGGGAHERASGVLEMGLTGGGGRQSGSLTGGPLRWRGGRTGAPLLAGANRRPLLARGEKTWERALWASCVWLVG